ncbi:MAG: carboxypeptidase regulatory-like domain-containing protein [Methanobrevibacter sp.]|uniref:carboxypeptidase-like regulatory domain-containing protein n=1 Tax=Methanobrevibacter sp. TaxID=66852 RepID=UPI0025D00C01|nr:carboxypeptidase-like regulatory domain-containing protein [Methanobrevibacter sp.]MBR0271177.1 carboxypeptidase regulatory-like domain-containing protein [Methanobrevibacter sp.]
MEYNKIIIILLVIIIILAAAIGVTLLNPADTKDPVKVIITSESEQNEGGKLSLLLTDLNNTALSNEAVNITVTDSAGKVVMEKIARTNSNGESTIGLDLSPGEYNVSVVYSGSEKYGESHAQQKLTINQEVVATVSSDTSQSSSTMYDINNLPPSNDPYPETNRYYLDQYTVKQEYEDGYMRTVDIRTGEIHSLGFK